MANILKDWVWWYKKQAPKYGYFDICCAFVKHLMTRKIQNQNPGDARGTTPLHLAERLTEMCGGAKIWLKREDLAHTGAHKINNAIGQCLLAKRIGKPRIIAETGAGQHGVATATICAKLGLDCTVYMGAVDCERQKLNVFRMNTLGSKVVPVQDGQRTLKDAINEAMRDWVTNVDDTHYIIGIKHRRHFKNLSLLQICFSTWLGCVTRTSCCSCPPWPASTTPSTISSRKS